MEREKLPYCCRVGPVGRSDYSSIGEIEAREMKRVKALWSQE